MKRIEDYINVNEGKDAFKNLDPDLYSLICKLYIAKYLFFS